MSNVQIVPNVRIVLNVRSVSTVPTVLTVPTVPTVPPFAPRYKETMMIEKHVEIYRPIFFGTVGTVVQLPKLRGFEGRKVAQCELETIPFFGTVRYSWYKTRDCHAQLRLCRDPNPGFGSLHAKWAV